MNNRFLPATAMLDPDWWLAGDVYSPVVSGVVWGKAGNAPRSQKLDRFYGVTGTSSGMMQWITVPMVGIMLSSTALTLIVMRRSTHR
jgi:hypothetical protein